MRKNKLTPEQLNLIMSGQATVSLEDNDLNINITAEHEGDQDPEAADADGIALDTSGTPEAAELDVQDAAADVEAAADDVESMDNTVANLESIALTLCNISLEGHQMTPAAVALLQNSVNIALTGRNGLNADIIGVASLEDFDLMEADALEASLEGVMDALESSKKTAVEFLRKLWANFVQFLKNMFSASEAALSKSNSAVKAVNEAKGETTGEVELPSILGTEISAKRVDTLAALVEDIINAKTVGLEALLKGDGASKEDLVKEFAKFNDPITGYKDKSFIGGFTVGVDSEGYPTVSSKEGQGSVKVKTPSVSELKAIAASTQKLAARLNDYQKGKGQREKFTNALIKANAESAGANSGNKVLDDGGNKFKAYKEAAKAGYSVASAAKTGWNKRINVETKVIGKAIAAVNAVNNVIAKSLKTIESK